MRTSFHPATKMANPLKRKRGPLSVPTTEPLPHALRLPSSHTEVTKILSKLSRTSLLSLASEWCQEENLATCGPYISTEEEEEDPEAPYTAAESLDEVQELYEESLPSRKGTKREVLDRILEGDWRHGISLLQLAMAETRSILEHPTALRWVAMRLSKPGTQTDGDNDDDNENDNDTSASQTPNQNPPLPHFHPQTFLLNLHRELAPLTKPHYYTHRPPTHPLTLIRLSLHTTPYTTQRTLATTAPKSIFLALPHATPFLYISSPTQPTDASDLHRIVLDALPRALSRPSERWELKSTALVARSLDALLALRGSGRGNAAQGGWSVYAEGVEEGPIEYGGLAEGEGGAGREDLGKEDGEEGKGNLRPVGGWKGGFQHASPTQGLSLGRRKRLKRVAEGRFGVSAGDEGDGKGLHRFDVKIEDAFPGSGDVDDSNATVDEGEGGKPWKPRVKLSFQGSHVFAGIRKLVESGIIGATKLPGWMTGEAGVSNGVVRNGRLDSKHTGV